jgi:hypothetical protein
MIELACSKCGSILHVPDQFAGKRGKCQKCGTANKVPDRPVIADAEPSLREFVTPTNAAKDGSSTIAPKVSPIELNKRANGDALKWLRLPAPVRAGMYAEISHNARLVRWGASIISFWGWATFVIGILAVIAGVLILIFGASMVNDRTDRAAAIGFAWGAISFGFSSAIVGILLIALAAFFKMVSHTCEAARDFIIQQISISHPATSGTNGSAAVSEETRGIHP